ncbi:MAG TPA: response regulator transcription factor [Bacteroidales bacterium]|nr:response regulator transcription factor [Bacteroidales bacterium]
MYRFLIIEDHPMVARGVERFLEFHYNDCLISKADSGEASLELLGRNEYDIVLLDINLPDISGIDLCRKIHTGWPHLRIIAISGMIDKNSVIGIMEAGASGYILKTSIPDEITDGIDAVMKGEKFLDNDLKSILLLS